MYRRHIRGTPPPFYSGSALFSPSDPAGITGTSTPTGVHRQSESYGVDAPIRVHPHITASAPAFTSTSTSVSASTSAHTDTEVSDTGASENTVCSRGGATVYSEAAVRAVGGGLPFHGTENGMSHTPSECECECEGEDEGKFECEPERDGSSGEEDAYTRSDGEGSAFSDDEKKEKRQRELE